MEPKEDNLTSEQQQMVTAMKQKSLNTQRGRGKPISVSLFIREYLIKHKEAYIYEMHKEYMGICRVLDYKHPRYQHFRTIVYILKRNKLLVKSGRVESPETGWTLHKRVYYSINKSSVDSPIWVYTIGELFGYSKPKKEEKVVGKKKVKKEKVAEEKQVEQPAQETVIVR